MKVHRLFTGMESPGYLDNGAVGITLQTANTNATLGNTVLGTPSDGSFADGYVALSKSTTIADAVDKINTAIFALTETAGPYPIGPPASGDFTPGGVYPIDEHAHVADVLDALNVAVAEAIATASTDKLTLPCDPALTVGTAVAIDAQGNAIAPDLAHLYEQRVVGVILSKPDPAHCVLTVKGRAPVYAGLTPGATYYVGAGGAPVLINNLKPLDGSPYDVQELGVCITPTMLFVEPSQVRARR